VNRLVNELQSLLLTWLSQVNTRVEYVSRLTDLWSRVRFDLRPLTRSMASWRSFYLSQ